MINDFDRFFLNLPPMDKEKDFDLFWDRSFEELKKIPMDPVIDKKEEQQSNKFEIYHAVFNGAGKYKVKGDLYLPQNLKKPKAVILIHDYNQPFESNDDLIDQELAFFFLQLRGHNFFNKKQDNNTSNDKDVRKLPGFLTDNILNSNNYYVKNIYLDVIRSIDCLRLSGKVNCSGIGIIGKGLGAAAAVFAAAYSDRIKSVVLNAPSFCYLELSQNISRSDATYEINSFISNNQSKKKAIKKNLSYFDAINFSDRINIPILAAVGLKDAISPPECVFALFNHFRCEKTMEVYPEDDHNAGGDVQLKKSIRWTKEIIIQG
ncbi:MAG: acetylxylan esterase [Spirochaetes bacterium]|nr:acetylxylan esterase [Spirochaetota bacterium]